MAPSQACLAVAHVGDMDLQDGRAALQAPKSQGSLGVASQALQAFCGPVDGNTDAAPAPSDGWTIAPGTAAPPTRPVPPSYKPEGAPQQAQQVQGDAVRQQQQQQPQELWFEMSRWTGRVHFHGAADGSEPLRLSIHQEALLADDSPNCQVQCPGLMCT